MKKIALTAALILILTSVTIIVIASSILSNSATTPSETEPEDKTEPTNERGPANETEPTKQREIANEIEQWSTPTRISSKVARGLCMSADGKKIVFLDVYDLFLMNTDGTGLKQLTHYDTDGLTAGSMGRPSISANGGKIAFKASKAVGSGPPSFYHVITKRFLRLKLMAQNQTEYILTQQTSIMSICLNFNTP